MRVLVHTDDRLGPAMAGSALRAWELARVLAAAGHEVRVAGAAGSTAPAPDGPPVVARAAWHRAEAVVAAPWHLPPRAFTGRHRLVVDGATPLLAELAAMPDGARVRRRRRTAAARLPLALARAEAVLAAGSAQVGWWGERLARAGRPEVPVLEVPFGIPEHDPPGGAGAIPGVPEGWQVVLWWGGTWPWLDLDTLLAARARLGDRPVALVVPTAARPGGGGPVPLAEHAARHALAPPAVVALETWLPYAERHRALARADVLAVLHHPGAETDLSFRTRALDGLWATRPLLVSAGGAVADLVRRHGWGEVVPPRDAAAVAEALAALLEPQRAAAVRSALAAARPSWRWPSVAEPLVRVLEAPPAVRRGALAPAALRAAAALAGRRP